MDNTRIGLKEVRALSPGEVIWDAAVPSFGARRQKGAAVAYVLKYRTAEGRQRWYTIGRHGAPWTPDMARDEARRILGEVVKGLDPATSKGARRNAVTVAELCEQYLADAIAGRLLTRRKTAKKASTLATDEGRIRTHIVPLLGRLGVAAVSREDIEAFMYDVAEGKTARIARSNRKRGVSQVTGGKGTASRTVGLLGAIFSYAVRRRLRPDNPVRGVMRFADGKRERRLSDDEYAKLGDAIRAASEGGVWPPAVQAARFLALTGWRSGEALGLHWSDIDLNRRTATLGDTKTGRSMRPLSNAACGLLRDLSRAESLIFPASRGDGRMSGFPKLWARIAKFGTLAPDITPHVLRHSFASVAADLGYSELTIAALLGHKAHSVTAGYVHSADAVLLAAADAVAGRVMELMGDRGPDGVVVEFRR